MDVRFLKDISEAYIIDSEIDMPPDKIFEELYDVVKLLREYDLELYNQLYESTKIQQQQLFKTYLDITFNREIIQEEFAISTGVYALISILTMLFNGPIIRATYSLAEKAGKFFEYMTGWINKQGKYMQVRYAMIYKNTKRCYMKCGIDTKKDIANTSFFEKLKTKQGQCLRECYLEEICDVIAIGMENYFACLKRTTGFEGLRSTNADDLLTMISRTNLSASCENFYTVARESLEHFYIVLDLMYDKRLEADKRLLKINDLRSKIYGAKQIIVKTNDQQMQRYNSHTNLNNQQSYKPNNNQQSYKPNNQQDSSRRRN